jgi:outer membrane immunogenic protein
VLGVEGDIAWADINGDGLIDNDDPISTEIDFLATLTGRIGVAWHRALFYVEGGGAWVSEDHTFQDDGFIDTVSDDRFGGVLGVGVEYALTANWSLKAEYNYLFLGSDEFDFEVDGTETIEIDQDLQTFKVGVNYRF